MHMSVHEEGSMYVTKVYLCVFFYRSGGEWCRGAGEGDHLLDGQAQFESVQRVADANLPLDLCV